MSTKTVTMWAVKLYQRDEMPLSRCLFWNLSGE